MKWSSDRGLTCGLKRENGKVYGFDQTFNIRKVQALFSGFGFCDLEKTPPGSHTWEDDWTEIRCRHSEDLDTSSHQITTL